METFRELLSVERNEGGRYAETLDISEDDPVYTRTYRIIFRSRPIVHIKEVFNVRALLAGTQRL